MSGCKLSLYLVTVRDLYLFEFLYRDSKKPHPQGRLNIQRPGGNSVV